MRPLVLILLCTFTLSLHSASVEGANLPSGGDGKCSAKYMKSPNGVKKSKGQDKDETEDDYNYDILVSSTPTGLCPSTCSDDADCVNMENTDVCLCRNQVNGEGEVETEVPATTFCTPDSNPNSKCAKMCSQSQVKPPFNNPYNCIAKLEDDRSTTIEYCTCAAPKAHAVSCNDSLYTETLKGDSLDVTAELCSVTCPSGSSCLATRSSTDFNGNCFCDDKPSGGALGAVEVTSEEYDYNYDYENYDYENAGSKVEKYFAKIECKPEEDGKTCQDCRSLDSIRTAPFRCDILGYKTAAYKDKDAKILQTFCTCANPSAKTPSKGKGTTQRPKPTKPPKGQGNNNNTKPKGEKEKPGNNNNNNNNNSNNNNKGKGKSRPKGKKGPKDDNNNNNNRN